MSYLADCLKKLKHDKRMLYWNLRQKVLTKEEHEKYLKGLEDLSHLKSKDKESKNLEQEKKDYPNESPSQS